MKFNILPIAALLLGVNASAETGTIDLGNFSDATDVFSGSGWDSAPFNPYYTYSGSQIIYTSDEVKDIADKNGSVTRLSFRYHDEGAYTTLTATLKFYVQAIDSDEFTQDPVNDKYYYMDYTGAASATHNFEDLELYGYEDPEFTITLDKPVTLSAGQALLVTSVCELESETLPGMDYFVSYAYDVNPSANVVALFSSDSKTAESGIAPANTVEYFKRDQKPVVKIDYEYVDAIQVEDPIVTPSSGTIIGPDDKVSITCATDGASIYYSIGASGAIDTEYTGPFTLEAGQDEIRVQARMDGGLDSETVTVRYLQRTAAAPSFITAEGSLLGAGEAVTLNVPDKSTVYYGFSGDETPALPYDPATGITIDSDVTVYAIAKAENSYDSKTVKASFRHTDARFLKLGDYDAVATSSNTFAGTNWYNAPVVFTYNNSATQTVYTPAELSALNGKQIESVTFRYINEGCFVDDYTSSLTLYLSEIDASSFEKDASGTYYQWFDYSTGTKVSVDLAIDFLGNYCDYGEVSVTLPQPFVYTGKSLLITVVNEAGECIGNDSAVCFLKYDTPDYRTAVFCSDWNTFADLMSEDIYIKDSEEHMNDRSNPAVRFGYSDAESDGIGSAAMTATATVTAVDGGIAVELAADTCISVYSVAGFPVYKAACKAGRTDISLQPGVYVVRVADSAVKVAVY